MIACEHVFNLHAWPTKRGHPFQRKEVEVTSCGSLCPLKGTISDDYQMQLSEHRSPAFTKRFLVILSCMLATIILKLL